VTKPLSEHRAEPVAALLVARQAGATRRAGRDPHS